MAAAEDRDGEAGRRAVAPGAQAEPGTDWIHHDERELGFEHLLGHHDGRIRLADAADGEEAEGFGDGFGRKREPGGEMEIHVKVCHPAAQGATSMDIIGKYIFVRLIEPTFWRMQGVQPMSPNSGKMFTLAGLARGENIHGIWLEVDAWLDPDGMAHDPGQPVTMLIPWMDTISIILFDKKPVTPPMGFRPR